MPASIGTDSAAAATQIPNAIQSGYGVSSRFTMSAKCAATNINALNMSV